MHDLTSAAPGNIRKIGEDRYFMSVTGVPIEFDLERTRRERGELIGELHVRTELSGARTFQGTLSAGTFNVSNPSGRYTRARMLADAARTKPGQIDWAYLLEAFCIQVLEAERLGSPAIDLRQVALPDPDDHHSIDGLVLPKRQASMIYADAATAKSLLALNYLGRLAAGGERVGFFDFELEAPDQRVRYQQLFGDPEHGPEITYVRCSRPLIHEADGIKRVIFENRLTYGVIDSVAFASGGKPEDAEQTLAYFRVLRSFGIGTLNLAHVPKTAETGFERPFGSQFWYNGVRSLWFGAAQATGTDRLVVGLYHRKNNLGRLYPAVAFQLDFEASHTVVSRCNLAAVQELAERLPIWQRMKTALTAGPKTLAALAADLGRTVDTLDRTVRRKNGLFVRLPGPDGISRIALLERKTA